MATIKQKKAFKKTLENGGVVSTAMVEAGYSPAMAKNPQKLTRTKGWGELVEGYLSDDVLARKHNALLNSTRIQHMTFPLGPKTDKERAVLEAMEDKKLASILEAEQELQRTTLTDEEITEMLAEVNCTVRNIVHGQQARHVYFWAMDNKAVKEALDMAYKLKGRYVDIEKGGTTVNNITQINIHVPGESNRHTPESEAVPSVASVTES